MAANRKANAIPPKIAKRGIQMNAPEAGRRTAKIAGSASNAPSAAPTTAPIRIATRQLHVRPRTMARQTIPRGIPRWSKTPIGDPAGRVGVTFSNARQVPRIVTSSSKSAMPKRARFRRKTYFPDHDATSLKVPPSCKNKRPEPRQTPRSAARRHRWRSA